MLSESTQSNIPRSSATNRKAVAVAESSSMKDQIEIDEPVAATRTTTTSSASSATNTNNHSRRHRGRNSVTNIIGNSAQSENIDHAARRRSVRANSGSSTSQSPAQSPRTARHRATITTPAVPAPSALAPIPAPPPSPTTVQDPGRVRAPLLHVAPAHAAAQAAPVAANGPSTPDSPGQEEFNDTITYHMPLLLPRPVNMPMVSMDKIAAFDPAFHGIALPFVQESLQNRRAPMLRGVACVDTRSLVADSASDHVNVRMVRAFPNDFVVYPTHLLAIGNVNANTRSPWVVYPINALAFLAHCARFPNLPPSAALQPDATDHLDMPLIRLHVPYPESFSVIYDFCYSRNFGNMCSRLCPIPATAQSLLGGDNVPREVLIAGIVNVIRDTFTIAMILEKMKFIHGTWANVCELGISDEVCWRAMNLSWQIMMRALTGKPHVQTLPSNRLPGAPPATNSTTTTPDQQ